MKKRFLIFTILTCLLLCGCNKDDDKGVSGKNTTTDTSVAEGLLPNFGADETNAPDGSGELPEYKEVTAEAADSALKNVCETFDSVEVDDSKEGLSFTTYRFGESTAWVISVDLEKYSLKASLPYDKEIDGTLQSLEGQIYVAESNGLKVVGGISANETSLATNIPCGAVVSGGKTVYTVGTDDGSVYIGLYNDGKAFACTKSDYEKIYRNKVSEMVSATHIIVKDGVALDIAGSVFEEKNNRAGCGFSADRQTLCLVYGEGIALDTLSNLLIANGCSVGVNFGNGETACMVYDELYGAGIPIGPTLLVTEK